MTAEKASHAVLNVQITPEELKKIVESGRLVEFVSKFPSLAAGQIAAQMVEQIAQAAPNKLVTTAGMSIKVGFDIDDEYGNGPHWPRPHGGAVDKAVSQVLAALAAH